MKFNTFYTNRPGPVCHKPDTETVFVDQSEADRASLSYQLERYGMDSLQQQLEKTRSQFGYADTRLVPGFKDIAQKVADANSYFMELPAQVRKKYNHDPIAYFDEINNNPTIMYERGHISKSLAAQLGVESAIDKVYTNLNDGPTDVQPVVPPSTTVENTAGTAGKTSNVSA